MRALMLLFFAFISYLVGLMTTYVIVGQSSGFPIGAEFRLLTDYRNVLPAIFLVGAVVMAANDWVAGGRRASDARDKDARDH